MDNLKQAYKTLGLTEGADRDQVEKRYDILLRQARAQQLRGEVTIIESDIHEAYRLIIEEDRKKYQEEYNLKTYGKAEGRSPRAEKMEHIYTYYKFHILAAIAVIALIIYSVNIYLDNRAQKLAEAQLPPPSLSVVFFGMYNDQLEGIDQPFYDEFPEWERIITKAFYVPTNPTNEYEIAMLERSVITLITEKPEIFIMDRENFQKFVRQHLFIPLDQLEIGKRAEQAGLALKGQVEEGSPEQILGVDLSAQLIELFPYLGRDMVVGITSHAAELKDNAIHFIDHFLKKAE